MRVISGEKRGHKLKAPKGRDVRPTEDRIKESLFNIINPITADSIVLDLFSGSGAIGIEFLSRGSKITYFTDISSTSISTIKENLEHTKLIDKSVIINKDAIKALKYFSELKLKFDYIYLDPPFKEHKLLNEAINSIIENDLLNNKGVLIIEQEKDLVLDDSYKDYIKYDSRNYGNSSLVFYRKKEV